MNNEKNKAPTPENAKEYAVTIVQIAKNNSNIVLDYSPRSLFDVDKIIDSFRKEGQSSDKISGTLFCFGCYVGEIIIKNIGGKWKKSDETPMKDVSGSPIVVELPNGSIVNPVGKVKKRMDNGSVDALPFFYEVFASQFFGKEISIMQDKKLWKFRK